MALAPGLTIGVNFRVLFVKLSVLFGVDDVIFDRRGPDGVLGSEFATKDLFASKDMESNDFERLLAWIGGFVFVVLTRNVTRAADLALRLSGEVRFIDDLSRLESNLGVHGPDVNKR